jgi:hypothetical protein
MVPYTVIKKGFWLRHHSGDVFVVHTVVEESEKATLINLRTSTEVDVSFKDISIYFNPLCFQKNDQWLFIRKGEKSRFFISGIHWDTLGEWMVTIVIEGKTHPVDKEVMQFFMLVRCSVGVF